MANDPPINRRMVFGYKQARAAGLGGVRPSRSPRQVNRCIKESKEARLSVSFLRDEIGNDLEWEPFIRHRVREGCGTHEIACELYLMQTYMFEKESGLSLAGRLQRFDRWSN